MGSSGGVKSLIFYFVYLFNFTIPFCDGEENTLKCVTAVWRHGDRNPYTLWPTDLGNPPESWPEGMGELTKIGIQQMYKLGQQFRERYGSLWNYTWNPDYVKFFSGEQNRTVASAQALSAGMFPPAERQIWNPNLLWLPIPIHARDFLEWIEIDQAVESSCPNLRHIATDPIITSLRSDNIELVETFEALSGRSVKNILLDWGRIVDPLIIERYYHNGTHEWPKGVTQDLFNQAFKLYHHSRDIGYTAFPDGLSLTGGWLLSQLVEHLEDYTTGDSEKQFVGYSGHDENLRGLGPTLGVTGIDWDFAAHFAIELHNINNQDVVQIWLQNGINADRELIELSDCPTPCSFRDFIKRSQPFFPKTEWDTACGKNTSVNQSQLYAAIGKVFLAYMHVVYDHCNFRFRLSLALLSLTKILIESIIFQVYWLFFPFFCLLITVISCIGFWKIRTRLRKIDENKPLIIK